MSKELVLPTSYHELEEFAKTVIALYQGNPVKNQNKLNEVMAKGLNLNNWDTLSAILNQPEQYTIDNIKEMFGLDWDDLISNVFFEENSYLCADCGSEWDGSLEEWDVPNICPHCAKDVVIKECVNYEENGYDYVAQIIGFNDLSVSFREEKEEALDFQRQYRKLVGLDEITGKPPIK